MPINSELCVASNEFVEWFRQHAIPRWSEAGIDVSTGASIERFFANGSVDTKINPRIRVQARQIFTFCQAHKFGWLNNGESVVAGLIEFSEKYGRHAAGVGYGHLLSPNNEKLDDRLDLYNHAFWLLSCAARYDAFSDKRAIAHADQLMAFVDQHFGCAKGGWAEGDYVAPCRRQNPHMHLFEAFMSLFEVTNDAKWLARAGEVFCLFESRFFDQQYGVLREFFDNDWNILASSEGDIIEPGHMVEWVWLLRWYERLTGHTMDFYANTLYSTALKIGMAPSGLLYDGVSPTGGVIHATQRCWPLIELVKASIAQASAGVDGAEQLAAKSLRLLLDKYLQSPVEGLYIDQRDENDCVCEDVAPASTLYHLIVAADEVQRYVSTQV